MTDTNERQVNVPLLRKAVEWAEAEAAKPAIESQWVQGQWLSAPDDVADDALDGTPADEMSFPERDALVAQVAQHCGTAFCIAGWVGQEMDARYATNVVVDGVHVADFAADALGIWQGRTTPLFDGDNTIKDVRRIAESLAGERL